MPDRSQIANWLQIYGLCIEQQKNPLKFYVKISVDTGFGIFV